jgi:hypothetical protein
MRQPADPEKTLFGGIDVDHVIAVAAVAHIAPGHDAHFCVVGAAVNHNMLKWRI